MRVLKNLVMCKPLYDAELVGHEGQAHVILPDSARNPMSQIGRVVGVGPDQGLIQPGDTILYDPYAAHPLRFNGVAYLLVYPVNIAGWLAPDGELFPLPWEVLVLPRFPVRFDTYSHLVIPKETFEMRPRVIGTVVRAGRDVVEVKEGEVVVFPGDSGREIGLVHTVWYTVPERELLAIIHDPESVGQPTE